jgi:hypothetical protein
VTGKKAARKWKFKELNTPIDPPKTFGIFGTVTLDDPNSMSSKEKEADTQRIQHALTEKLLLLFDEFEAKKYDWRDLCSKLAFEFVPGLKLAQGSPGRPRTWSSYDYAELKVNVNEIREELKCTIRLAISTILKKGQDEGNVLYQNVTKETLKRYYNKADERLVNMVSDVNAFRKTPDFILSKE